MAWGNVDDKLHGHVKAANAGLEAMGLWLMCKSWVCDNLTDGFIPRNIVERYAGGERKAVALAKRLVACGESIGKAGFWEPRDGGYQMHDYLEYDLSASEIIAKREAERTRKSQWRRQGNDKRKTATSQRDNQQDTTRDVEKNPGDPTPTPTPGSSEPKENKKTPARAHVERGPRALPETVAAVSAELAKHDMHPMTQGVPELALEVDEYCERKAQIPTETIPFIFAAFEQEASTWDTPKPPRPDLVLRYLRNGTIPAILAGKHKPKAKARPNTAPAPATPPRSTAPPEYDRGGKLAAAHLAAASTPESEAAAAAALADMNKRLAGG